MSEQEEEMLMNQLEELKQLLEDRDYAAVVSRSPNLVVAAAAEEDEDLLAALYEIWFKALVHENEYATIVNLMEENKNSMSASIQQRLQPLVLYALYRLERYPQVIEQTKKVTESALYQHLYAQSLYHMARTPDCVASYQALLAETDLDDDAKMEAYTNAMAALGANALPYTRLDNMTDLICHVQAFLEEQQGDYYPYDLAYNLASYELLTDASHKAMATGLLRTAQKACTLQHDDDDLEREVAPIVTNLEWSRDFWTGHSTKRAAMSSKNLPTSVQTVQTVNRALALSSPAQALETLSKVSESGLTPLQTRSLIYNRAVLQLAAGRFSECQESCQSLENSLLSSSISKKKKKHKQQSADAMKQYPTACTQDSVWWESRIRVLQAYIEQRRDNSVNPESLQTVVDKLQELPASPVRDHALCYVQLHQAHLAKSQRSAQEIIDLLQELPESIRLQPAVTASLASLYHEQGREEDAEALLLETGDDQALADFCLSQGKYAQAAAGYEQAVKDNASNHVAYAKWVQALSHVDPQRALQLWSETSIPDLVQEDEAEIDAIELEERELPRLKTSKPRKTEIAAMEDQAEGSNNKTNKKSHEAVLRRRARKRDEYISQLEQKGLYRVDRPTKPDPERWLPKYERSHARRRRHRGQPHKGAQGGISEKDAAKLDVAARRAHGGEGDASGRSTAHVHLDAAGGQRKGGRRR